MIAVVCPTCKQPRRTLYPYLEWARFHNRDLPKRAFVSVEVRDKALSRYPREIYLQDLSQVELFGFIDFCEGHDV